MSFDTLIFIGNTVLRQRVKVRSYKAKNAPLRAQNAYSGISVLSVFLLLFFVFRETLVPCVMDFDDTL